MRAKIETVLYKIILSISYIAWIKCAMPDSENGKKIGIVLVLLSIVFCLCISKITFSSAVSISTKRRILLCAAIIGIYYMCTFYFQYNNRENILVKLIIIAVLQLPAIVFTICSLLGLTDIKIIDSVNGIAGMAKRINVKLPFVGVFAIFVVILYSFSYSIWFDETFTLGIIQHSYSELIYLTGCDVHPPMYYILLKGFADGIGSLLSDVPVIYCARFFSSIPYIVLLILQLIRRKKSGEKLSLNIMLLMFCMPNIMDYGIEVRMYSLALVLVLVAYMLGYRIYYEDDNRWTNWIALAIVSLLSIYTHYYCGICIIAIYFLLFFKKLKTKEVAKEVLMRNSETIIVTDDTEIAYSVATAMNRNCIFSGQIGAYLESIYSENLQVLPDATEELIEKMKPVLFLAKDSEEIPDKSDDRVINGIIFREVR